MTRFETFHADDPKTRLSQVKAPGTGRSFTFVREAGSGGLLQISAGGRTYLETGRDGWTRLDRGMGCFRETRDENTLRRHVDTPHGDWEEVFGFDAAGMLTHVDGVDIHRDANGRVTACLGGADLPDHRWVYAFAGAGLASIESPSGVRHLSRMQDGRVTADRMNGRSARYEYDSKGRMRGIADLPRATHHADDAGRVWGVTDPAGRVVATFIWDGWRCIGRIDGAPGDPLAAWFSLDPSATPVRVITPEGVTRIPRDAYGEGLVTHRGVPGLFGAFQSGGMHHLPWRILDPRLGAFTAPDPFDGSETDPRRGDGAYQGDLDIETDRQRPYDVCRNDPVGRADPSGGISAGLLISSLTWSFQNNLLTFFGIDWWFNLFGSLFSGSNFFDSEGLVSSDHIGAFGVRRDGVIPRITKGRAFTTQHIVWDFRESFDELNDGMLIDPGGRFDPPLQGGPLLATPSGLRPFLLRGVPGGMSQNWHRNGGPAEPSFPGASQPVFPSGGFHFTDSMAGQRGPLGCPLTELVPGPGVTTATVDTGTAQQLFEADETTVAVANRVPLANRDPVLLEHISGERLRTRVESFRRENSMAEATFDDPVPDALGPDNITLTRLDNASTTENATDPGGGVQGFAARGLTNAYPPADWLEIRSQAGGVDVTLCHATGPEARLPLNAPVPAAMTAPLTVSSTTLSPPVSVTIDGTDGLAFPASVTPPAAGIIGLVSDGSSHIPVRITDDSASPILRIDSTLSGLGAPGTTVTFRTVTTAGLLGRRSGAPEADPRITYEPGTPGVAPDGSASPTVVLIAGSGGLPDAARLVTGAPTYDAILTDQPIAPAAPWVVQKWSLASGNNQILGFRTIEAISVTPDTAATMTGARAVRVFSLDGAANVPTFGTARLPGLTMNGATGTVSMPDISLPGNPRVTDVIGLRQGGTDTLHTVAGLRLSFEFDRSVDIDPDTESYVVRLRPEGFEWTSERVDNTTVTVTPFVDGVRSQFPRIRTGAAVRLDWRVGGTADVQIYRVEAVEGLALTLDGPVAVPAGIDAGTLTVRLLEADDPGTGHQKIAINLDRPAGAAQTTAEADVWTPNAFIATGGAGGENGFGLVSNGITTPVVIQPGTRTLTVRFSADTGLSGSADLHGVTVLQSWELPITGAVGRPIMLEGSTTDLAVSVVQPFVVSAAAAASARFLPGDVIIPEEENMEINRRQALVDHELEHTAQYNKFGPIWFCYFPLFLAELPVEFTTDLDQPNFGPFNTGTLERVGARVRITPATSIDVSDGDVVQVFQQGMHERLTVASLDGSTLVLRGTSSLGEGAVELRKVHDDGIWSEVLLDIARVTTHGGLLNTLVGFTWGGLLWLLSKGIYGAIRAIGGAVDQYPGDVAAAGTAINLISDEGRRELNADGQFIIKSGEESVVRRATRTGDQLVLDQPIAMTGQVQVSAYASLDPGATFDWLRYKPGTMDETNPAAINMADADDFSVGDRIEYIYLDRSGRTHVSGKTASRIELEEPPAISGTERSIRVALLAEAGTTLANADEAALNWMGMGWMRLLFDPYGQIEARVRPEETWSTVLLRVMRVVMGSRNWSALPLLGYVFWARLIPVIPEHRTMIEQKSSDMSGDLYTPLSRLNGEVRREDRYAINFMSVGDIARFRHWPWPGWRDHSTIGPTGDPSDLGAPGLHQTSRNDLRVIVNRTSGPNSLIPNRLTVTDTAGAYPPATALPDAFYTKNFNATLGDLPMGEPLGFSPADLGTVPLSPALVRNPSAYVAFCRPGLHRATLRNTAYATVAAGLADNDGVTKAFDAQLHDRQNLWFNINVRDVTVNVNGQPVSEGGTVALVQTQTARIDVVTSGDAPAIPRVFRASVARPRTGPVLRSAAALRLVAQGANSGAAPERVEISRFFEFDESSGTYSDPALSRYGTLLGGELDIPVRGFDVTVGNELPLLSAAQPGATIMTNLAQGATGFLLIPTSAGSGISYTLDGAAPTASDPALAFDTVSPGAAAARAVGPLGQVRSIRFDDTTAITIAMAIEMSIPVTGEDGSVGTLRVRFTLDPP